MDGPLAELGVDLPVLAAPMAGGATTPELVVAAASVRSMGFLAAGYLRPEAFAAQLAVVRAARVPFGVNLFAPNPVPVSVQAFRDYARALQPEASRFGLELAGTDPVEDDDHWPEKVSLLLAQPVPVVSFTFGVPEPAVIAAFRAVGTFVLQTVTSVSEAELAILAGADGLIVQSSAAGGHSATLTPGRPPGPVPLPELVAQVWSVSPGSLPLFAAGGLATAADVALAIRSGASAAMVGTALLLTSEAGTSATHRDALMDPAFDQTAVTHAFTGRPARGLRNRFIERYDAIAPLGYPALHHLTSPLRKAAAAAGDAGSVHLWSGTGYREAREEPAATTLTRLVQDLF
ncbi:nitronate monooxygenase family protein [Flindersiella endophytica]